ncbi:lipid A biosynthesis acyltransferase [Flavihumibacter fluvii]|uniref:LpxL/LpxP family acyltransferase n=1 Tax=Flavihumibacter fluvii TaxID=2838157 RepID=UPI001BDF0F73|nr:lipid A biosynthesis acyltransferase [Flavihumibacter fluvii]ULQ51480.1 lipid A biosynthesis acyltransferase [Flavihumibacter fluvii]
MPSWEGRSKATPLGYRIFVGVLKTFGLQPAYGLLRIVALYYVFFSPGSTKHQYQFFHKRLGFGQWASIRALYRNYFRFGQTLIDKVVVQSGMPIPYTFEFEGEEYLREMVAAGKGGLLLSAHIGNWEIAGHLLKRLNTTINVVMYDGEQEQIKAYLEKVTGGRNMNLILIREDLSHIFAINEALDKNQLVCIHADRFVAGNKTLSASFLGASAKFPAGPFILASVCKVPVSFVFAFKETSKHYHLFATKPAEFEGIGRSEKMQQLLDDFVAEMEQKAKLYPDQWFNYYDFWKT